MLCVKTTGSTIVAYPYSPTDLIRDNPSTSFPAGPLSLETLSEWGVFPVTLTSPPIFNPRTQRLLELHPSDSEGEWVQGWVVEPLSPDEIIFRDEQQAAAVRSDRNARLAACDWTQVLDAPVDTAAWAAYRQNLRDVPSQVGFPWEVIWPVAP